MTVAARYAPDDSVRYVVRATGCTDECAIAELIAEEGNCGDAIDRIRATDQGDGRESSFNAREHGCIP